MLFLPAVGCARDLPAVGPALVLPAVGFALLGSFHHRSRSSFLAVLVTLLLYFVLLTTSSLAVVPSVILSHHWLFGCGSVCASSPESLGGGLRLRGSFLASSDITTQR